LVAAWSPAATITVDTTADDITVNSNCTLREAIQAANTNAMVDNCTAGEASPVVDLIDLPAGVYDLTLQDGPSGEDANQEGDLDILEEVEIDGAGMDSTAIDGQAAERVFHIQVSTLSVVTTLRDLEVRNGFALGNGGGIYSLGNLFLYSCRVTGNTANSAPGGGISHSLAGSVLKIYDSEISSNEVVSNSGGGISSVALTEIFRSAVINNIGTGVANALSTTRVYNSTISGNSASGNGGGMYAKSGWLYNSTVVGNSAGGGLGGNLYIVGTAGVFGVRNSIVADAKAGSTCFYGGGANLSSLGGSFESPGDTCNFGEADDTTDVALADLGLTQLLDLGGPTPVHGLFPESVAVDTAAANCELLDQRSEDRDDGLCDAGAFEVQGAEDVHVIFGGESGSFESGFGDWVVVGG
jgi:CSLREA domain-containing protein